MLKAGVYEGKVFDAGMTTSKDGQPMPFMKLELGDDKTVMTWYGSLKSEKSQEIAVKAALAAGFNGTDWDQFDKLNFKPTSFTVTLKEETYEGKTRLKIAYINPKKETVKFQGQAPKMAAAFAQARQTLGLKKETAKLEDL